MRPPITAITPSGKGKWLAGERLHEQTAYWKDKLEGIPELLSLPTDRPRPEIQTTRGGFVGLDIDSKITERLTRLARTQNLTLFMVLESLWALFPGQIQRR